MKKECDSCVNIVLGKYMGSEWDLMNNGINPNQWYMTVNSTSEELWFLPVNYCPICGKEYREGQND